MWCIYLHKRVIIYYILCVYGSYSVFIKTINTTSLRIIKRMIHRFGGKVMTDSLISFPQRRHGYICVRHNEIVVGARVCGSLNSH